MRKYAQILLFCGCLLRAQAPVTLTNETVIRLVQAGVPTETIIRTIASADSVEFHFVGLDLQRLLDYGVPDDVFKAMAARDKRGPKLSARPPVATAVSALTPISAPAPAPAFELGSSRRAEPTLTNESIVKLVKAGMSEDVVLGVVNTQPDQYSLTTDDLIALKQAGVGQKVIAAMILRSASPGAATLPASIAPTSDVPSGAGLVNEVGVYIKRGNSWEEVVPEPINWKTGGVVKHVVTVGIVKGDRNGILAGPGSRNIITLPAEFLIYTREAESYGEYQLLKLRERNDAREFRVITGGVFHEKGGAQRDLIMYDATRIAPRTYHFVLKGLGKGEFGFLPPNLLTTTSASAQLGKMYSFRVRE